MLELKTVDLFIEQDFKWLPCIVYKETEKAYCLSWHKICGSGGSKQDQDIIFYLWIPKCLIDKNIKIEDIYNNGCYRVFIPYWLRKKAFKVIK
jgi:hypothetical protein